jgi:hypothetical protein
VKESTSTAKWFAMEKCYANPAPAKVITKLYDEELTNTLISRSHSQNRRFIKMLP